MIVKQKQIWLLFPFVALLLTLSLTIAGCGGTPTPKPQPTLALKVRPDTTEVQVGESVAIVAEVEPLEKLDLRWSVSGTAGGTLNTDTGEQVVYTASQEGTDIVVAQGTTASGARVKQTVSLTVVGGTVTCPSADAEGTVSPAVAVSSITFVVNGVEQVVDDFGSLQVSSGEQVEVKEVTICVDPFGGKGGQVYVEFDPVDTDGAIIEPEVKGTRGVPVTAGFTTIPGPYYTWTIGDNWRHISVVTVHYPPGGGTQNPNCEGGACEVDDRVIVPIQ